MVDNLCQSIWINANLATMDMGAMPYGTINGGAIGVSEGKIIWLGNMAELPGNPADISEDITDCEGAWITPGLIDCHTHLIFGGNRVGEYEKRLVGESYEEIARQGGGIRSTVDATRSASHEELLKTAKDRIEKLISEGVTTVEIKSGYGLDVETEIKMLRVARQMGEELHVRIKTSFLGAHTLPVEYDDDSAGYIDLVCDQMMPAVAAEKLADAVDVFCEGIAFDIDETR